MKKIECNIEAGSSICTNNGLPNKMCILTPAGEIPVVSYIWSHADYIGEIRSRISSFRMNYRIEPGIYAVGSPDAASDVFTSANYKLSFDILRRSLAGINAWILVLDTKGINVWCAAGKGTFGTDELIRSIRATGLKLIINHNRIIAPQLGAPGITPAEVMKETGCRVLYGPVRASDIPGYISGGYKATPEMRRIDFTFMDRLILTPIELNPVIKVFPKFGLAIFFIFGLGPRGILFSDIVIFALPVLGLFTLAVLSGSFITPVMLPYIPFRSFALKGWICGFVMVSACVLYFRDLNYNNYLTASYLIFLPVVSSYLALQFTGATTFTNLSGVMKEIRYAMPVYKISAVLSFILLLFYKMSIWRFM